MGKRRRFGNPGRKSSGNYDQNGHRISRDAGTPELAAHRTRIAGADAVKAENPLSALLAREFLDERQHRAGCIYAGYRGSHLGGLVRLPSVGWAQMVPTAVDAAMLPSDEGKYQDESPTDRSERIRLQYVRADNALRRAGPGPRNAVKSIACYHDWSAIPTQFSDLVIGLNALADLWGLPLAERADELLTEKAA